MIQIAKFFSPAQLRFYAQVLMALPAVFMLLKVKANFGDNYVLNYIENGEIDKLKKFLLRNGTRKINKYYYRIIDVHTFERHTLLTSAVFNSRHEMAEFLLGFPSIDLHKTYLYSESSFNHREKTALELARHSTNEIKKVFQHLL